MVMGPVEATRPAGHRFQQVGPPYRRADLDGLRGIDRPHQPAAAEYAQFDPDAVFGTFLALARVRIPEVQVSYHHANPLESEGIEHQESLPHAADLRPVRSFSHAPPSSGRLRRPPRATRKLQPGQPRLPGTGAG